MSAYCRHTPQSGRSGFGQPKPSAERPLQEDNVPIRTPTGLDQSNPIGHVFLRGNGKQGRMGWSSAPKVEALRQEWIDSQSPQDQKKIAIQIQARALEDLPYVPLGQYFLPTAFRKNIAGVLDGFVLFWNVR
jgi:peptide/nickel transport system substrate-binding protein